MHAEGRVVGLKKRIEELRLELEAANLELEQAKRVKETTEQELKGYEVELALNYTAIHSQEVWLYTHSFLSWFWVGFGLLDLVSGKRDFVELISRQGFQ